MDTCTNCGATLRPGAKFCTTCGTRLNETPSANNDDWGTPRNHTGNYEQETSVIPAVQPQEPSLTSDSGRSSTDTWGTAYGASTSASDDPASRFISALHDEVAPVRDEPEATSTDPESTWGSPAPVFTPPPASNWSYSSETDETAPEASEKENAPESPWETPSSWSVEDSGNDDGSDEGITSEPEPGAKHTAHDTETLEPDEARDKAIALADELRRTIRMMSSGRGESDHGAAIMALTEASLHVGDFSDVRGVLTDVRNDPRDIQALGNLAEKIDRLEALLDEHRALADAIETAIKELSG